MRQTGKTPVCCSNLLNSTFKRFAPNLPMLIRFAAAQINPMSERYVRHQNDHGRYGQQATLKTTVDDLGRQHRTHCNCYCNTLF
jgi:hypothetical protein